MRKEGWIYLFDGKSFEGWGFTRNREAWSIDDGAILCATRRHGGGGYLYTLKQYDNFILSVDFKFERGANSGVFIRVSNLNDRRKRKGEPPPIVNSGLEIQILDDYGEPPSKHSCGAIYDLVAPIKNTVKPAGEWNNFIITCRDNIITVDLNGERITEMDVDKWDKPGLNPVGTRNKFKYAWKYMPRKGHIALQNHGPRKGYTQAKVWFKNIKLKPIDRLMHRGED